MLDSVHEYFLVRLPQHVRQMYARDLAGYTLAQLRWAIDTFRVAPPPLGHKKTAPKPHDLIALLQQQLAERQAADAIASAIWCSIARFGRTQTDAAMAYMGADGQEVVRQMGGWQLLCKTATAADVNLWNAQLRDKALAVRAQKQQARHLQALAAATCGPPAAPIEAAAPLGQLPAMPDMPDMQPLAQVLQQIMPQEHAHVR